MALVRIWRLFRLKFGFYAQNVVRFQGNIGANEGKSKIVSPCATIKMASVANVNLINGKHTVNSDPARHNKMKMLLPAKDQTHFATRLLAILF